jgi:hypothetical protein
MTTELELETETQNETLEPSLVAVPSNPTLKGNSIWLTTFYNQRLLNMKPEAGPLKLPSFYQIGDDVEFALEPEGGETEIFSAVIYAVKFSGNGSVSYDLAVPVNGSSYFTIISDIRDGLRKAGAVAENIWNIFNSSIMLVQVGESEYDGQKGRDFTKSKWTEKKTGVSVKMDDNSTYTFSEEDNEGGKMRAEAIPAFKKLIEILNRPNLSVHNYFSYKVIDDPKNTPETNEYLKKVDEKLATIIPIIKNAKSIEEIQQACTVDTSSNDSNTTKNTGTNILAESLPEELRGSVIDTNTSKPTTDSSNSEAASILDGI